MSGGLRIDTDLVSSSGTGINTSGVNFQSEVASFKTHVGNICGIWTGVDADEFANVANEVGTLLDKAAITVQGVGTHLVNTASAMDETVNENKGRMAGV